MSGFAQCSKKVTLAAGGGTARVYNNVMSSVYKNFAIWVDGPGNGQDVTTEIFYGGSFEDSSGDQVPSFTEDSTHVGGVSQGAATAISSSATTEISHLVYEDAALMPINSPSASNGLGKYSPATAIELVNNGLTELTLTVTFLAETIGGHY